MVLARQGQASLWVWAPPGMEQAGGEGQGQPHHCDLGSSVVEQLVSAEPCGGDHLCHRPEPQGPPDPPPWGRPPLGMRKPSWAPRRPHSPPHPVHRPPPEAQTGTSSSRIGAPRPLWLPRVGSNLFIYCWPACSGGRLVSCPHPCPAGVVACSPALLGPREEGSTG